MEHDAVATTGCHQDDRTPIAPLAGCGVPSGRAIPGMPGDPIMAPVADLVVDHRYQRRILASGRRTIARIVAEFDWAKFLPVVVVRAGGRLSLVDGQHRATAAATLGIAEVPAYVLACSAQEAAAAFVAINANVTKMDQVDIWFARLEARDPQALALKRVLDAADVAISRKNYDQFDVGETRSVSVLFRALDKLGPDLLTTALQCITQTGDGSAGYLQGALINGVAGAIRSKSDLLAEPSRLFDLFDEIDLESIVDRGRIESIRTRNPLQFIVTREINAALRAAAASSTELEQ